VTFRLLAAIGIGGAAAIAGGADKQQPSAVNQAPAEAGK
jgi:hypothetical protein